MCFVVDTYHICGNILPRYWTFDLRPAGTSSPTTSRILPPAFMFVIWRRGSASTRRIYPRNWRGWKRKDCFGPKSVAGRSIFSSIGPIHCLMKCAGSSRKPLAHRRRFENHLRKSVELSRRTCTALLPRTSRMRLATLTFLSSAPLASRFCHKRFENWKGGLAEKSTTVCCLLMNLRRDARARTLSWRVCGGVGGSSS